MAIERIVMKLPQKPFYFIRHGETDWNKDRIIQGHQDIPLNEMGVAQAHEARRYLKNVDFGHIYTSPLQRAYHTAQILNEEIQRPMICLDALKERTWGVLEGHPSEKLIALAKGRATDELPDEDVPLGAETWGVFEARVFGALHDMLKDSAQPPLIVAHGGVFVSIVKALGTPHLRAHNCALFFFSPPQIEGQCWVVNIF